MSLISKLLAWIAICIFTFIAPRAAKADIVIIPSIPYNLQNGTVADASQVMANFNTMISYVNSNGAGNGANTSITSLTGLTSPPAGSGSLNFYGPIGSSNVGGTANAITITTTYPGGWSLLTPGACIWFQPTLNNTGAATININSVGAVAINKKGVAGLSVLNGGELTVSSPAHLCYNGTVYILDNAANILEDPLAYTNLASAGTTTLSSANCPNFKCQITGITTITSFGTGAVANQIFYLQFTGGGQLTYNASSMILPGGVNISTKPQDTAAALYLGGGNWQVLWYTAAIQQFNAVGGVGPSAGNLAVFNDGTTPTTKIDVTALYAVLTNNTYTASVTCTNVSVVINTSSSGGSSGNDLDTGSRAAGVWYHVFIISNGTTCAGLASQSSTNPTLPTGYGYYMRVGAMSTDGSGNFYLTYQAGKVASYYPTTSTNTPTYPVLANGSINSNAQVTGNGFMAPSTAQIVVVGIFNGSNNSSEIVEVAPLISAPSQAYLSCAITAYSQTAQCTLPLLGNNSIYIFSNAGSATVVTGQGWTDAVNAN